MVDHSRTRKETQGSMACVELEGVRSCVMRGCVELEDVWRERVCQRVYLYSHLRCASSQALVAASKAKSSCVSSPLAPPLYSNTPLFVPCKLPPPNPPPNPPPYDLYYKLVIISIVLIYNNKKVEGYNKVKK